MKQILMCKVQSAVCNAGSPMGLILMPAACFSMNQKAKPFPTSNFALCTLNESKL